MSLVLEDWGGLKMMEEFWRKEINITIIEVIKVYQKRREERGFSWWEHGVNIVLVKVDFIWWWEYWIWWLSLKMMMKRPNMFMYTSTRFS